MIFFVDSTSWRILMALMKLSMLTVFERFLHGKNRRKIVLFRLCSLSLAFSQGNREGDHQSSSKRKTSCFSFFLFSIHQLQMGHYQNTKSFSFSRKCQRVGQCKVSPQKPIVSKPRDSYRLWVLLTWFASEAAEAESRRWTRKMTRLLPYLIALKTVYFWLVFYY